MAMGFALDGLKNDKKAVIFAISIQNYDRGRFIRMNSEAYSAFPKEREILLQESLPLFILDIEQDREIKNVHFISKGKNFNRKTITIVHMFHAMIGY